MWNSFATTVQTPRKCPGPRLALKSVGEGVLVYGDREIVGVHFLSRRAKKQIYPRITAELFVVRFRARIFLIVAPGRKLERIHKNADHHFPVIARRLSRDPDQFAVTAMERPHRRHKHSPLPA